MKSIEEYFIHVRQLIQGVPGAHTERHEEQILSATRGDLRIRLRFSDQALLEISESLVLIAGQPRRLSYRYHYQDSSTALVFRYDNAPHHPEVPTHPDHEHRGDHVLTSADPSIEQALVEVRAFRERTGSRN